MMARRTGPMLRFVPLGSQRTPPILTVGLLVGGPLPRRARVTEVDLDVEGVFDVGPAGHLASLVPGEGAHEVSGLAGDRRGDRGGDAGSVVAVGSAATRVWRLTLSVRVTAAERLFLPMMRSPSQWPASLRPAAAAGRSAMGLKSPSGLGFRVWRPLGLRRRQRLGSSRQQPSGRPLRPVGS